VPSFTMYGMRHMVTERLKDMGNMSAGEKRVAAVFGITALLWVARAPLTSLPGLEFLSDPLIGMAGAVTMFVVTDPRKKPLMAWKDMKRMPWDILLLFGGGLSIASGLSASGAVNLIRDAIMEFSGTEWILIVLIVTALSVFLTELMSNVALTALLLPVVLAVAAGLGGAPLELAIPLTLGASCAFMLPIATPPNAVVFSASFIRISDMVRAGFWINAISVVFIVLYCLWAVPLFF